MTQMIALVQAYINHRTGKTVQISIRSPRDFMLLKKAYDIAVRWFEENEGEIKLA